MYIDITWNSDNEKQEPDHINIAGQDIIGFARIVKTIHEAEQKRVIEERDITAEMAAEGRGYAPNLRFDGITVAVNRDALVLKILD